MTKFIPLASVLLFALSSACSSSTDGSEVDGSASNGDGSAGSGFVLAGNAGAGSGMAGGGLVSSCLPKAEDTGCVGEQYVGETVPLDVYILFDQSCSMSCPISRSGPGLCCTGGPDPRIAPVRDALDAFLRAPESKGIGFGLGYFGGDALGKASCEADHYKTPAVNVAAGQADKLVASLKAAQPTGETPTGAALRGACTYARQYKNTQPSHQVVILLVTDGVPETPVTECGASLPDAVQAAKDCAGDSKNPVKIYVLGIGKALSNLNQIAAVGGTGKAHLVEGGDVTASMIAALNAVRGEASIPCQLKIPPAPSKGSLDYNTVNVGVCDAAGKAQTTVNVSGAEQCANGAGWYYDDPANPQRIMLCKASCDTVTVPGAQLYYSVGCATQTVVR